MREQANIPPANNPAGADWRKVLVVLQTSLAAAQQERYMSIKGPFVLRLGLKKQLGVSALKLCKTSRQ